MKNKLMNIILKNIIAVMTGSILSLWIVTYASALPLVVSVDMDPFTTGIQNTLTVTEGDSFQIQVRVRETALVLSDSMQMIISYNDSGSLLSGGALTWGAGLPSLPLALDLISLTPPLPPLGSGVVGTSSVPPGSSPPGFAGNSGLFGLFPSIGTYFTNFNGFDDVGALLTMEFNTNVGFTGTSNILAHGQYNVPLLGNRTPFTSLGLNIDTELNSGLVKVIAQNQNFPGVPEPATMLLFGSGLIGLAGISRKYKK